MENNKKNYYMCDFVAKEYGAIAGVLYSNIEFWLDKNKANNKHFHDNKFWTYNSMRAFTLLFPMFTEDQIRNSLKKMIEGQLLIKGNFNKMKYDRTSWYSINYKKAYELQNAYSKYIKSIWEKSQMETTETPNGNDENPEPIPYNNTYNNTDERADITSPFSFENDCFSDNSKTSIQGLTDTVKETKEVDYNTDYLDEERFLEEMKKIPDFIPLDDDEKNTSVKKETYNTDTNTFSNDNWIDFCNKFTDAYTNITGMPCGRGEVQQVQGFKDFSRIENLKKSVEKSKYDYTKCIEKALTKAKENKDIKWQFRDFLQVLYKYLQDGYPKEKKQSISTFRDERTLARESREYRAKMEGKTLQQIEQEDDEFGFSVIASLKEMLRPTK